MFLHLTGKMTWKQKIPRQQKWNISRCFFNEPTESTKKKKPTTESYKNAEEKNFERSFQTQSGWKISLGNFVGSLLKRENIEYMRSKRKKRKSKRKNKCVVYLFLSFSYGFVRLKKRKTKKTTKQTLTRNSFFTHQQMSIAFKPVAIFPISTTFIIMHNGIHNGFDWAATAALSLSSNVKNIYICRHANETNEKRRKQWKKNQMQEIWCR